MGLNKKINLLQLAKLQAVLFALIGLCFGIYYSIGSMFIDILVCNEVLQVENWDIPGLTIGALLVAMH